MKKVIYQKLFLALLIANTLVDTSARAQGVHATQFLECSELNEGDFYAEIQIDQNNVVTSIITATYLERQGPINPRRHDVEMIFQKGNPPQLVGYSTEEFRFKIKFEDSPSTRYVRFIATDNQGNVQENVPCQSKASSRFPELGSSFLKSDALSTSGS